MINELVSDDEEAGQIEVGVQFEQQVKNSKSVPDALIVQKPFQLLFETKLALNFDENQLTEHLNHFIESHSANDLLLSLAPTIPDSNFIERVAGEVSRFNSTEDRRVRFLGITFAQLLKAVKNQISDRDYDMADLASEFEEYCRDEGLLPRYRHSMRAVLSGKSLDFNFRHNVYFHTRDRGFSYHGFVGLYAKKAIRGIGRLMAVVDADLDQESGRLTINEVRVPYPGASDFDVDQNVRQRIIGVVNDAPERWHAHHGHYFFVVDEFVKTDFNKTTPRGIQGPRFFDLADCIDDYCEDDTTADLAEKLKEASWK